GAEMVILAARSVDGSYEHRVPLDDAEWRTLLGNLDRVRDLAGEHGLAISLHSHVGTAIEGREAVLRLLDSGDWPLCLGPGPLLRGGPAPRELVRSMADRVAHVHPRDARASRAKTALEDSYVGAVRGGLYTPLGDGDLDIAGIVGALQAVGYQGWYV